MAYVRNREWRERLFWRFVGKGSPGACWPWLRRARLIGGYGYTSYLNVQIGAHRLAFMFSRKLELATLPPEVCHTCDNPECCNPEPGHTH